MRALAYSQCGPSLIPASTICDELSLLLVLALLWGFFSRYSGVPPSPTSKSTSVKVEDPQKSAKADVASSPNNII